MDDFDDASTVVLADAEEDEVVSTPRIPPPVSQGSAETPRRGKMKKRCGLPEEQHSSPRTEETNDLDLHPDVEQTPKTDLDLDSDMDQQTPKTDLDLHPDVEPKQSRFRASSLKSRFLSELTSASLIQPKADHIAPTESS